MKVLVSGSTGLIGTALVPELTAAGHEVVRLIRPQTRAAEGLRWDPAEGRLDPGLLSGFHAVVNLCGRSLGAHRWSDSEKARLWESRVATTSLLAEAIAAAGPRPDVLINASAVGVYGDGGDAVLTETSPPGGGFLAELIQAWEAATDAASRAGTRVVLVRSGIVLSADGGGLATMLAPFGPRWLSPYRWGLGGPVAGGRQYWSWISRRDEVRAITHLLGSSELSGPVNLVSPNPVTHRRFVKAVGRALRRPTVIPIPPFVPALVLGSELVRALIVEGQRAVPERLLDDGFTFLDEDLDAAMKAALGK